MTIQARYRILLGSFELNVNLDVPSSGITVVFGPSGAGKSTLLRAISGLLPTPGALLRINGDTWQDGAFCLPTHRRQIGFVFQEPSLFQHLTVRGNLSYGRKRSPSDEPLISFDDVVTSLGIESLLSRRTAELSGGEQQRVAIARAVLSNPKLLLLDEPLSGLDSESKNRILPFLARLDRELAIPILYVSHSLDEVARLGANLILLDRGQSIATGAIAELMTDLNLPLARSEEAGSIIDAVVTSYDDNYHLLTLRFPGGELFVTHDALPVGAPLRLRVLARDVSLTAERQEGHQYFEHIPGPGRNHFCDHTRASHGKG